MKNMIAMGMLATLAFSSLSLSVPAYADPESKMEDAHHEAHEARKEEAKAQRDAAVGDVAGAERHEEKAAHDRHEARHDVHKANREAAGY
ncbi:MAG TPA: hypothetical protein V6C97_31255 [Oculatellaceae cyanobacterium]